MEMNHLHQNLSVLIGHELNVLLSDGNSIEGILAGIKEDYLVIETEKYYIYHNLKNVKGFLKNTKKLKSKDFTNFTAEERNLEEVLKNLHSKWVSIDSQISSDNDNQNKQGFSGFLSTVGDDHVILIGKEVQMYLNTSHINNIILAKEGTNNESSNDNSSSGGAYTARDSIFGRGRK